MSGIRWKKGRKSYFYKFLMNFMLVLIVPVVTIIFIYLQAERTVKEQILISSSNTLTQFFQVLETIVDEMESVCISVGSSEECQYYSMYTERQPEKTVYQSYLLKKMLNSFQKERYYDIFVYFPETDKIVSNNYASMTSEYYYQTYYGSLFEEEGEGFLAEFQAVIKCDSKNPALYTMNRKNTEELYLCVAVNYKNYLTNNQNYVVAVILKPEMLNQLIAGDSIDAHNIIMMFDKDREFLLSNVPGVSDWTLEGYEGTENSYEMEKDGESYVMHVQESETVKGYYVSATPYEYFWEQLWQLRIMGSVGAVLCILISILFAFHSTWKAYQPVGNIVNKLQEYGEVSYDERKATEFDFIEDFFEKEKKELGILNRKIRHGEDMRKERFFLRLMEGCDVDNETGDNIFEKNGITLCSDRFLTGIMAIKDNAGGDSDIITFAIKNVFEELINKVQKGYVIGLSAVKYVILINPPEGTDDEISKQLLEEGQAFLQKHYKVQLTIGISTIHEGITGIAAAYREAEAALQYKYLFGEGGIIEYSNVRDRKYSYLVDAESRLTKMVRGYIQERSSKTQPPEFLKELLETYEIDESVSMKTLDYFCYDIVNTMNWLLMTGRYRLEGKKDVIKQLTNQPTFSDFKEELKSLLSFLCKEEEELKQQDDVCSRVARYIEENITDSGLSVSTLGEAMEVSPYYLSKLFKDSYGTSVLDYISRTRIQKSKPLLKETRKSIQEISEEMGFLSSNVYIKAFKKWEGITPGVYRELS